MRAVSYFLTQKLSEEKLFSKTIRIAAEDAWSEIGKRLLNSFHSFAAEKEKNAQNYQKKIIFGRLKNADGPTVGSFIKDLAELAKAALKTTKSALDKKATKATTAFEKRIETVRKMRKEI